MYKITRATTEINDCNHKYIVTDTNEGTQICTDCALVISDVIYADHDYFPNREILPIHDKLKHDDSTCEVSNVIFETLEKWFLPSKYYWDISTMFATLRLNKKLASYKPIEIASFATFVTLINNNTPLSPSFVCSFFQVNPKILFNIERDSDIYIPTFDLTDVIRRFATNCELNFRQKTELTDLCMCLYGCNNQPQVLSAALIYVYCHHKNISIVEGKVVTVRTVAERCLISSASIHRLLKKDQAHLSKVIFKTMQQFKFI